MWNTGNVPYLALKGRIEDKDSKLYENKIDTQESQPKFMNSFIKPCHFHVIFHAIS